MKNVFSNEKTKFFTMKKNIFLFFVWAQYKMVRLTRIKKGTNTSANAKKKEAF